MVEESPGGSSSSRSGLIALDRDPYATVGPKDPDPPGRHDPAKLAQGVTVIPTDKVIVGKTTSPRSVWGRPILHGQGQSGRGRFLMVERTHPRRVVWFTLRDGWKAVVAAMATVLGPTALRPGYRDGPAAGPSRRA